MLLILFLEDTFKLYYINKLVFSDLIRIGSDNYYKDRESSENEGFIGFFDWLRKTESEIIGVRLSYFEHHIYNNILKKLSYVNIENEGKWIEVLFKKETYDSSLSGDQDFANNYVYKSNVDKYLFTFGLDHLTEEELKSLLIYCEVVAEDELK